MFNFINGLNGVRNFFNEKNYGSFHLNENAKKVFTEKEIDEKFICKDISKNLKLDMFNVVNRNRIIQILNGVADQGEVGISLLDVIKKTSYKIIFIMLKDNKDWPKEYQDPLYCESINDLNGYVFFSENAIASQKSEESEKVLLISILENPPNSVTRVVFDGKRLSTFELTNLNVEAYCVSHELTHVVSFLEAEIANAGDWGKRKCAWEEFLQTDRMKDIASDLLKSGLSEKDIYEAFDNLFANTEDARNLLGFKTKESHFIGEFFLFNQKYSYLLPTYVDVENKGLIGKDLIDKNTAKEKPELTVLKAICKNFKIEFQQQEQEETAVEVNPNNKV